MKKIVLLLCIAFALNACSLSDEPTRDFVLMPIEDVTMPDTYTVGNIAPIMVKYRRPTQCHIFDGFYIETEDFTKTVAIKAVKLNQNNCNDDSESLYEIPLNFKPMTAGVYTFKFWTGKDSNGVDQFLIVDAEVL